MCGITGIYSNKIITNLEKRIVSMNDSIIHRGPDAGDFFIDNKLAFGHRRLSIIDTSVHANQPMHSKSNVWHMVFNGEIYNFKEIKEELSYSFLTSSDSEVIIAAVEEKGFDWFIDKANGMFAIALYNSLSKELYLVRDRLGIKPLYYYRDKDKIVFSSEIKAILSSGLVAAKFNELAVDEYLGNRYVRAPYTFFENIYQLEAGAYLKIDYSMDLIQQKYWEIPQNFNTDQSFNEEELKQEFEKELIKSIKYRLISDVPLGTYLSGGVDSSLITAITAKSKKEPINTYTIGFPELNEFEYSKIIAEQYGTIHHEIMMTKKDYVDNWERLIGFKDAPLGVPNEIPLAVMSKKLKEKITVVLSGEGADELMGGYGRIFRAPFDYKNEDTNLTFYEYLINDYEYVSREMRDNFLTTSIEYRKEFDKKIVKDFYNKSNEENVFRFFHKFHVKGLLQRVDMTTMQTSVEARVPFLDHKLIEFVYTKIPYNLKLKWKSKKEEIKAMKIKSSEYSETSDTPKYLLREVAYNHIPKSIVDRKKVGFPVPLTKWFNNLEEMAKELLTNVFWLKEGTLNNLLEKSKKEPRAGQVLWMFINIEIFRKQYFFKDWEW
ncbi:asparagine synthase (glutamine-hydrolyzing) [uncultured Polaribacter sp.]|uniref:asparagine synthase (glutamine-hydrolyzing) n=1 Tax=uncultured Polaribacter sp. TaxID=174711 RepID=UPI00260EE964|nr:asparagine synthase (glutamine-hydrolyzing) [uncultured Polaribacter sp.]